MLSGLIGVPLGSFLAQRLRPINQQCDPQICAWGLFISAPMVFIALNLAKTNTTWCYIFVFLAEISLNLCWSIVADILLVSDLNYNGRTERKKMENRRYEMHFKRMSIFKFRKTKKSMR